MSERPHPAPNGGVRVLLGRLREAGTEDRVAGVVAQALAAQLGEVRGGQIARPPTRHPGVECDVDALVPGGLGALYEAGRQLTVGGCVELEKAWRVTEFGGDVLH